MEIIELKSRKPLIWRPTCIKITSLVDSIAQIILQQEDIRNSSTTFEHFATLRTKYVSALSTMEDAKTRAATFNKKANISHETRKLDPESLAIQVRLRASLHHIETSMESLTEQLDNMETSNTPSKLHKSDVRQPFSANGSYLNAIDV
jgi:hypothetical protein